MQADAVISLNMMYKMFCCESSESMSCMQKVLYDVWLCVCRVQPAHQGSLVVYGCVCVCVCVCVRVCVCVLEVHLVSGILHGVWFVCVCRKYICTQRVFHGVCVCVCVCRKYT